MTVRRYDDPEAFLACIAARLAVNQAKLAMFRSWIAAIHRNPRAARYYLAVYEGLESAGEAFQNADGAVVVGDDVEAARAFAIDLAGDYPQLRGVVGPMEASEAFASEWTAQTGRIRRFRFRMRNHVLDALVMPRRPAGFMRGTVDHDLPWLVEAQLAFADEANLPDSRDRLNDIVAKRHARGEYRIWEDDGPVALAGWTDGGASVARIAPVYTVPQRRRRGYAAGLIAELVLELRAASRPTVFLVTDVANPGANALYAKVGFRPLDDFLQFDFVDP